MDSKCDCYAQLIDTVNNFPSTNTARSQYFQRRPHNLGGCVTRQTGNPTKWHEIYYIHCRCCCQAPYRRLTVLMTHDETEEKLDNTGGLRLTCVQQNGRDWWCYYKHRQTIRGVSANGSVIEAVEPGLSIPSPRARYETHLLLISKWPSADVLAGPIPTWHEINSWVTIKRLLHLKIISETRTLWARSATASFRDFIAV